MRRMSRIFLSRAVTVSVVAFLTGLLVLLAASGCRAPSPSASTDTPTDLRQTLGSLILPRLDARFVNEHDPSFSRLLDQMRAGELGGVVAFAGNPETTARMIQQLRNAAPRPILVASDYEWGAAMRVEGATRFPRSLAMAAAVLGALAEQNGGSLPASLDLPADHPALEDVRALAKVTAEEAKAIGVDLVLAPVADLLSQPLGSVIASRAPGDDAVLAASIVRAFVTALQAQGVLATVKHFPGHGNTEQDSHQTLPSIPGARSELFERELIPFQAAIDASVAAVMPGHLIVEALDPSGQPASRSELMLEGLLRQELGFSGLVVSDALEMSGARMETVGSGEEAQTRRLFDGQVAVDSLRAGNDLLLVPSDPTVVLEALVNAFRRGVLTQERVDQATARVAQALSTTHREPSPPWQILAKPTSLAAAKTAHRRSITVLKNTGVLPLGSFDPRPLALFNLITDADEPTRGRALHRELTRRSGPVAERTLRNRERAQLSLEEVEVLTRGKDVIVLADWTRRSAEGIPLDGASAGYGETRHRHRHARPVRAARPGGRPRTAKRV